MKVLKSDLLLKSESFPVFNDIASKLNKCLPFLPYLGGKKYKDLCILGEKYSKGTVVAMEPVLPSSLSNPVIHKLFIAIINVIRFFCGQAAKGEDSNLGHLCSEISDAMNRNNREDYLFTCLEVPNDNIKLAVVKCLDKIPLDEIDLEEFGHVVRVLGSYKNLGVGKTEEVLGYIFLLLTKITKAEGPQADEFRNKLGEMVIMECLNILARNQERNLLNDADEHEEKMSLTMSCVFFLKTASTHQSLKQHMSNTGAIEALKRVLKAEELYSKDWLLPVDIERTWVGRSIDTLLKCFQGSNILVPYHEVSMRVMARMADVLMNMKEEPILDPWKGGEDDIIQNLKEQLMEREKERHDLEDGIWEDFDSFQASDARDSWERGHVTFVQTKAIESMLNYLMGRISILGPDIDARLKSEYNQSFQKNELLDSVKNKLQALENSAEKADIEEEKLADKKLSIKATEKETLQTAEIFMNALQGETLDENRTGSMRQSEENLTALYKGNALQQKYLKAKSRMLSSYLRCIKAALENYALEETRDKIVESIRNPKFVKDLTMLCATTRWHYSGIAGKYLRVMKFVVEIPPKDNEAYDEHISFLETVSLAIEDILKTLVPKLRDRERNPLNSQDQFLISEATRITAVICQSCIVNRWSARIENKFDEATSMVTVSVQDKIVGFVIKKLVPLESMKAFTEIIFYEMALSSRFKPLAYKRNLNEAKLMDKARCHVSEVFAHYMTFCSKLRYQLLEFLQAGLVFNGEQLRSTYMQDILNRYQTITYSNELGKFMLKNHLAFQVGTSNIPDRILGCSWVDMVTQGSGRWKKQLFLVTSRKIYLLNESGSPPCPLCGPERFCPVGPTLKTVINYEGIRVIIRFPGVPQMLGLDYKEGSADSQICVFLFPTFDTAMCFLEKIEYITHVSNRIKQQQFGCVTLSDICVSDTLAGVVKDTTIGASAKMVVLCSYKSKSFTLWQTSAAIPDLHFAVVTDKNVLGLFELNFNVWAFRPNLNELKEHREEAGRENEAVADYENNIGQSNTVVGLFTLDSKIDPSFIKNVYIPEEADIKFVISADREYVLQFQDDLTLEVLQRSFMKPIISARPGTKVVTKLSEIRGK